MNTITYRLTLNVLKGGVQKILNGFFAGDVLSRRIAVSLTAGSTPVELAQDAIGVMYIFKANGTKNFNVCKIEGNTVYYDFLQTDTDVEGIAKMQLKVISNNKVLYAPYFAIEVQSTLGDDTEATNTATYTVLEEALIKAETVYNSRLISVDIEEDLTFIATYADGTTHESDAIKNAFAEQSLAIDTVVADLETLEKEITAAEQERAIAEAQRAVEHEASMQAETGRVVAEQQREARFSELESGVRDALDETTTLQAKVNALVVGGGKVDEETVQSIIDAASAESNEYTDTKISELLSGAPGTLDTLKEISDAMAENESVVNALNEAIGSKASKEEVATLNEAISNKASKADVEALQEVIADKANNADIEALQNTIENITSGEEPTGNASELEGHPANDFLLKTETAADSNKLGGQNSSYYASKEDVEALQDTIENLASAESVANIINGTTPVKKANNADGASKALTADTAAKATADGNGNNIAETYLTKSAVVITDTNPGEGASVDYPDNTLIFVKKTS